MRPSASVPKPFVRRAVYPLKEAVLRRRTLAIAAELGQSERLSRDELLELQTERFGRILRHAYEHVPYYRRLFDSRGLSPEDIRSPADLPRLPILTKEIIRRHRDELTVSARPGSYVQMQYTSGSTGEPVAVPGDALELSTHLANQLRGRAWHGIEVGDDEVRVWHDPRLYARSTLSSRLFWSANAAKDRLLNIRMVAAADLSEAELLHWERTLCRSRPRVLYGYAASIFCFARYLGTRAAPPPRVETVIVTAEKILPAQKELIAEVFGARVLEEYGSAEVGVIAFECPSGGLHTSDESLVLELAETGPDGAGELLVTSLSNRVMPLIRYRIGDVVAVAREPCGCGRALGRLEQVVGRTTDYLLDAGGAAVHPFSLMLPIQRLPSIERYRVVQTGVGTVELHVQAARDLTDGETAAVRAAFADALGDGTAVAIRRFRTLPPGPRGKHRFLTSHLGSA